MSCCNDIHTCHAELIHAAAEIQFATGVRVTTPANSNVQAISFPTYFEVNDTVDVYDIAGNGAIISTLALGLTVNGVDLYGKYITLSAAVDTTLATGTARFSVRDIRNTQRAIDRLYRVLFPTCFEGFEKLQILPGFQDIKIFSLLPDSVLRLEFTVIARDILNTSRASFTRIGLFYREGTGPCKHQGPFWQTVDTLKSHVTMDVGYALNDNTVTVKTKNAGNVDTFWRGTIKKILISS